MNAPAQPDRSRFRVQVTCKFPFSQSTDWATSLTAARRKIRAMCREFVRGNNSRGGWSRWEILDLKGPLRITDQGANLHYVQPTYLHA